MRMSSQYACACMHACLYACLDACKLNHMNILEITCLQCILRPAWCGHKLVLVIQ